MARKYEGKEIFKHSNRVTNYFLLLLLLLILRGKKMFLLKISISLVSFAAICRSLPAISKDEGSINVVVSSSSGSGSVVVEDEASFESHEDVGSAESYEMSETAVLERRSGDKYPPPRTAKPVTSTETQWVEDSHSAGETAKDG